MALLPRDRRRVKTANGDGKGEEEAAAKRSAYEEYYHASKIRVPDSVPASAGGLNKTNWDLEIRKRYTQPLSSEALEFPDATGIYARMVPICYEESVVGGAQMQCAELVAIAAEAYVKEVLWGVFNRTRSNGPKYENGAGGGIFTSAFKRQVEREEKEVKQGKLETSRESGQLPVESREAFSRRPIGMADMKMASYVGYSLWNGMPLIGSRVTDGSFEDEQEEWRRERESERAAQAEMDGVEAGLVDDPVDTDDDDYGWEGFSGPDREALGSLLEDCLAIRA